MSNLQPVVLLGAPRSGTTWLQSLLGSHPAFVTPQETDLFTRYVAPLRASWEWSLRGTADEWRQRRYKGLPAVLTERQFDEIVRDLVASVLDHVHALDPTATILVEKSPSHSLHPDLVARYLPGARFVHIVRDGRAATASVVSAAAGWGRFWAPPSIGAAARIWRTHVEGARSAKGCGAYAEVRYEDLRGTQGAKHLEDIFRFCGAEIDSDEAEQRLAQRSLGRNTTTSIVFGGETRGLPDVGREPDGFVGSAGEATWRSWTITERLAFAEKGGALLERLGYEPDDRWIGDAPAVARARLARATRRWAARAVRSAAYRVARGASDLGELDDARDNARAAP